MTRHLAYPLSPPSRSGCTLLAFTGHNQTGGPYIEASDQKLGHHSPKAREHARPGVKKNCILVSIPASGPGTPAKRACAPTRASSYTGHSKIKWASSSSNPQNRHFRSLRGCLCPCRPLSICSSCSPILNVATARICFSLFRSNQNSSFHRQPAGLQGQHGQLLPATANTEGLAEKLYMQVVSGMPEGVMDLHNYTCIQLECRAFHWYAYGVKLGCLHFLVTGYRLQEGTDPNGYASS